MIRAGWRGTAIGIESGSPRVRLDLVRKGGIQLSNEEILENLERLKRVSKKEGVYFYINGFLMAGFPELPLPNGKVVPPETEDEMESTRDFAIRAPRRRCDRHHEPQHGDPAAGNRHVGVPEYRAEDEGPARLRARERP
jgi:hypothetical protein